MYTKKTGKKERKKERTITVRPFAYTNFPSLLTCNFVATPRSVYGLHGNNALNVNGGGGAIFPGQAI